MGYVTTKMSSGLVRKFAIKSQSNWGSGVKCAGIFKPKTLMNFSDVHWCSVTWKTWKLAMIFLKHYRKFNARWEQIEYMYPIAVHYVKFVSFRSRKYASIAFAFIFLCHAREIRNTLLRVSFLFHFPKLQISFEIFWTNLHNPVCPGSLELLYWCTPIKIVAGVGVFPRMDYIRRLRPQGVYLSQASGVMNGTDFTRSGIWR